MYEKAKKFTLTRPRFKKTLGWVCVVLGGVAFILPLIPGAPLLVVGLELIGFRILFLDRLLGRAPAPVMVTVSEQEAIVST